MTEDTSPENLRKFLESDDPAMVLMGLSMAKGSGVPEELYNIIFGLSQWNPEQEIREVSGEIVKKIGIENIPEFQLPNYISSNFQDWLYDNLEIFESAIQTLKNIGDKRSVGLLIEILALIPVNSGAVKKNIRLLDSSSQAITNALEFESGDPVWLEDTRALEPLIRIVDNCDKIDWWDDNRYWEPKPEFVFWAIEALGRIGDTRALGALVNALYWGGGEEGTEDYTYLFSWPASKALAKILLKFEDGIPEEYGYAAIAAADYMIWLIIESPHYTLRYNDGNEVLYGLLKPLSKLAEIGWDAEVGDHVTGLCGWDPEFFDGKFNGEFDLKAFLR